MGYVIAAYGIVFASLIGYGILLARERASLRKSLSSDQKTERC